MEELIVSLHMHTNYSDGSGSHRDIAMAALKSGLDAAIVTDHNVYVTGPEGYTRDGQKRTLLLIGEEIHDQARSPQKNHLLVFNARRELANFAPDPQILINQVKQAGGLSFIAHLYDPACPPIKEVDISWVDWQVFGFTGIELWNSFSELKIQGKTYLHILFYVFFPNFLNHAPPPQILAKWDELLNSGQRIVAVGGADAHALHVSAGPIKRVVFPYEFHFKGITNHLLTPTGLSGDMEKDKKMIYEAFEKGHSFVSFDAPAATRGFRFTAQGREQTALMGDEINVRDGVTLNINLPEITECRLVKDGQVIKTWNNRETCTHITNLPGVYRVEVYRKHLGARRGWIFSNPIYCR